MEIDLRPSVISPPSKEYLIGDRTQLLGSIKARYMIQAQRVGGVAAGSVELGYRTLAAALKDYNGNGALTYEELIDMPIKDTAEILNALNQAGI